MKKLIIFLMLSFAVSVTFAQQKNLTGPKAKNYKIENDPGRTIIPIFNFDKAALTGPKAKNTPIEERQQGEGTAIIGKPVKDVTGPKAKNRKY